MTADRTRERDSRGAPEEEPRLPRLGAPAIDTHAHLDMLDDPVGALERAAVAGVESILTVVDLTEEPERTFEGLDGWLEEARVRLASRGEAARVPEVRIILGVHPHNAARYDDACDARLRRLALDPRVSAIGEAGLDFHYDNSPRDDQRGAMRRHLVIARETGLPVCLHLREAHDEGMAILLDVGVPEAGCVLHCFTEGPATAAAFLAAGCHIAFGGVLTFPKAVEVRDAVGAVPLDRLLVETDCPFLTPAPYRGRTNEPAFVTLTVAKLAEVTGVPVATIADATSANARRLFGLGARKADRA